MRYQERIYIQNDNEAVRNRDLLNVSMSSDICVFNNPLYTLSGASKIDCSGNTGTTYVVSSTATTIPMVFDFTGNTTSFINNSATFKYEIYKYNTDAGIFYIPPMYKSDSFQYSSFSGTNTVTQSIPLSGLSLDGEYLVKVYFNYNVCTGFMDKIGKTVDTLLYRGGTNYGIYDGNEDYFFRVIQEADTPTFLGTTNNTIPPKGLNQYSFIPIEGITEIVTPIIIDNQTLITLNGLILAKDYDYTYSGNIITLSSQTVSDDIITIISGTDGTSKNLQGDYIIIDSPIVSGTTDNEGSNRVYYNIITNKYEIYTNVTPQDGNDIMIMLNGATLANNIDYYQSTTNPKRIILEGDLIVGDIITLAYYAKTDVVNGIITNNPMVTWLVKNEPQLINGYFSLEVSTGNTFSSFYYSGNTPYVVGQINYNDRFTLSGPIGTKLYYRVKNQKNYVTMCGDIVSSTAYSEMIPITIQSNAINSY